MVANHKGENEMRRKVEQCVCDVCHKTINEEETPVRERGEWVFETEVGDLCPSCARAWANLKQSFIEKMRIENKENII